MTDPTFEKRLGKLVGELHALLKGTTCKMAPGDVEFFPGGEELGQLQVDIRGRRYRITVKDIGASGGKVAQVILGMGAARQA